MERAQTLEWVHHHRNPADGFSRWQIHCLPRFSSLIQIIPAAINAATCAGRLMSVSELEKENALDMEKVDRILEKEYKGITIELKKSIFIIKTERM